MADDDLDPAALTAAASPWVAVSLVDPASLAEEGIRIAAALASGRSGVEEHTEVPGIVLTATDLRDHGVNDRRKLYASLGSPAPSPAAT